MNFLTVFFYSLAVGLIALIVYAAAIVIPQESYNRNMVRQRAEEMGCEIIGRARNLENVWFLNCNYEVKMIYTP